MMAYIFLTSILALCAYVSGYPYGTPDSACQEMVPTGHGGQAQTTASPFTISLSSQNYSCGNSVYVTLSGTADFKGFFCQARTEVNNGSTKVGEMGLYDPDRSQFRCGYQAITHRSRTEKPDLEFVWNPTADHGNVYIVCTFVYEFSTYWVRQPSEMLQYQTGGLCSDGSMTSAYVGGVLSCLVLFMIV